MRKADAGLSRKRKEMRDCSGSGRRCGNMPEKEGDAGICRKRKEMRDCPDEEGVCGIVPIWYTHLALPTKGIV